MRLLASKRRRNTDQPLRFDVAAPSALKIPSTLAKHNWRNPSTDPVTFKTAFGADQDFFRWLGTHPKTLGDFNEMMKAQRASRQEWYNFFPVQASLLNGFEGGPLLVDVGGAQGYELQCFRERYPQAKGHLILQDLPHVIDSIQDLSPEIRRMKHDFFTEQPVKGMDLQVQFEYVLILSRSKGLLSSLDFPRLAR